MKVVPSARILYDLGPNIGLGHFTRSSILGQTLKDNGFDVSLERISLLDSQSEHSRRNDGMTDVVIFDVPINNTKSIAPFVSNSRTSIGLDWFGQFHLDYNIVVYPHIKPQARKAVYVGFEYIIIDGRIASLNKRDRQTKRKEVLIVIGGQDPTGIGITAGQELTKHGYEVHLVLGPLHSNTEENVDFRVSRNVRDMSTLISTADWMVTNGGGCLFEAMCSGRPAVALPQTVEEKRITTYCQSNNSLIGTSISNVQTVSESKWQEIRNNGITLVDGIGQQRILKIVQAAMVIAK